MMYLTNVKHRKTVMLHGYYGYGNIGDEAILSVLIDEYRSKGFNTVVLSVHPVRTKSLHGVKACKERLLSPCFWQSLIRSSRLVFGGGGKYGKTTFRRIALLVLLAKLMGKSVEFRAVGVYPYQWCGTTSLYAEEPLDFLTRFLLKLAFRLADFSTVRDEYSKRFVESYIAGKRVFLELDPALRLEPDIRGAENVLKGLGLDVNDEIIGLNVRFLRGGDFGKVLHALIQSLNVYLKENGHAKILFIPFGYGSTPDRFFDDDVAIGGLIGRHLSKDVANRYYIIERELRPQVVLGIFKFLRAAIVVRYHGLVFAHRCGVPVLCIAYDTKVLEYFKLMERLGKGVGGFIVVPKNVSADLVLGFLRSGSLSTRSGARFGV